MNTNAQNRLDKGSLISFLGIYALLTVSILWVGYFMYREQEHRVRLNIEHQLAAVAELKTNELVRWREERYRDGVVFYNNPAFTALFNHYLQKPNDAEIHKQLMGWLTKHMDQYHYNQKRLMDVRGTTILSVPGDLGPASSGEIQSFAEILSTGEPSLSDFYRSVNNQHIYLAMQVPIIDLEKGKTPIGLLTMYIYSYIVYGWTYWPKCEILVSPEFW